MALSNLFLPFVLFILSIVFLLKKTKKNNAQKLNLPPSPPKLPIIGNLHQMGSLPHKNLRALSKKYGGLMFFNFGSTPILIVSNAESLREISKYHDVNFSSRPKNKSADIYFYGYQDVAFCPYGEYWRQVKKICVLEVLSVKRVQEYNYVREEEVAKMLEKARLSAKERRALNMTELTNTIANNTIAHSALGRVYEKKEEGEKSFGELAKESLELMAAFSFKDFFPSLGWVDDLSGLTSKMMKNQQGLNDIFDQVIKEHEDPSRVVAEDRRDIVDILLEIMHKRKLEVTFTRESIKAILVDLLVAGTDTTSTTLEWAMAELMKKPKLMKKAQEEVRNVVGKKPKMEESDLNDMPYLKCVVKETLRLHPPAATIMRETNTAIKLKGYDIPAKTRVLYNIWSIQRDSDSWENPDEFIPERFMEENFDYKDQSFKLCPFGAGRRLCPGLQFGLVEAEFVLANMLCWINWTLPDGVEDLDMNESPSLVVHKKIPLRLVPTMSSP